MKEALFLMHITMWGSDGLQWHFIGNHIALQQAMTEEQCLYLIDESMWQASYENEFYQMRAHCRPADCALKDECK